MFNWLPSQSVGWYDARGDAGPSNRRLVHLPDEENDFFDPNQCLRERNNR